MFIQYFSGALCAYFILWIDVIETIPHDINANIQPYFFRCFLQSKAFYPLLQSGFPSYCPVQVSQSKLQNLQWF